jgi:hypothetical protein
MTAVRYDTNARAVEELCRAYRAIVKDPAYGAVDRKLLSIAARPRSYEWRRHLAYFAAALLVVASGLAAMLAAMGPYNSHKFWSIPEVKDTLRSWTGISRHSAVPLPNHLATYHVSSQSEKREQVQNADHSIEVRSGCSASGACQAGAPVGPASAGLKVSGFLIEPMKAAIAARKAAMDAGFAGDSQLKMEELQVEIQQLLVAQTSKGRKTPYDEYLIDSLLGVAYGGTREFAKAVPFLQAAALSRYASPAQRKGFLQAATAILNVLPPK